MTSSSAFSAPTPTPYPYHYPYLDELLGLLRVLGVLLVRHLVRGGAHAVDDPHEAPQPAEDDQTDERGRGLLVELRGRGLRLGLVSLKLG